MKKIDMVIIKSLIIFTIWLPHSSTKSFSKIAHCNFHKWEKFKQFRNMDDLAKFLECHIIFSFSVLCFATCFVYGVFNFFWVHFIHFSLMKSESISEFMTMNFRIKCQTIFIWQRHSLFILLLKNRAHLIYIFTWKCALQSKT